jgi:hypothetical protein
MNILQVFWKDLGVPRKPREVFSWFSWDSVPAADTRSAASAAAGLGHLCGQLSLQREPNSIPCTHLLSGPSVKLKSPEVSKYSGDTRRNEYLEKNQ